MGRSTSSLQTVERAFDIIHVLQRLGSAGPATLARHMDIPKSTVYDYLKTLESIGYVVHENGHYHIGYQFLSMGSRLKYQNRLFQISEPELKKLATETGELSNIGIEEDGDCIILHASKGAQSLDLGIYPGLRLPMHSHATGKVILAYYPKENIEDIIQQLKLEKVTEHTITDVGELKSELDKIREDGYATDWDQQVTGMGVVAVPILIDDGILGALSIVCPTGRLQDQSYRRELTQKAKETATTIMANYQYGR